MKKTVMIFSIMTIINLIACKSVGPSDRQYLSDSEMQLAIKKCEKMELNFMLYREGSSGANGGKSGGGCGCN